MINKKHNFSLEVCTPLHIGGAKEKDWINGIDFVYNEQNFELKLINHRRLARLTDPALISNILISKSKDKLQKELEAAEKIDVEVVRRFYLGSNPGLDIKAHQKNALTNKPIVPGSSIKGAIRSVLFKHLRAPTDTSNESVFGSIKNNNDFMRFIKVGDAQFNETELFTCKIFNLHQNKKLWESAWKHAFKGANDTKFRTTGFISTFETIPIEEKANFSIMLSDKLFNLFETNGGNNDLTLVPEENFIEKRKIIYNDIDFLLNIINSHTRKYIESELSFFKSFNQAQYSKLIIDEFERLHSLTTEQKGCCLLRMSSGSGYHSITGDWMHVDHKHTIDHPKFGKHYKSRRIAFIQYDDGWGFYPMGFVRLKRLD